MIDTIAIIAIDMMNTMFVSFVLVNEKSCSETARWCKCYQKQEPPVPPSVEDVGHHHDEEVLQFQVLLEDEPIEQKHDRQEDGEFYGVEKHLSILFKEIKSSTSVLENFRAASEFRCTDTTKLFLS